MKKQDHFGDMKHSVENIGSFLERPLLRVGMLRANDGKKNNNGPDIEPCCTPEMIDTERPDFNRFIPLKTNSLQQCREFSKIV
ncbi:hypothetical protein M8J75_003837 [Diaphorina citri]|nr:hypothetical protein M8J75_003837 [Diaphorina citri]